MDRKKTGALLVMLAGACWGSISLFINYLSDAGLTTMQISFLRQMLASLVICAALLLKSPEKFRIHPANLPILMLVGLVNGVMFNYLYFFTIVNSRASIAVVLLYTSTIFVMLMSRILFKEKLTPLKITALILTVAGCVLVTGVLGEGYTPPAIAILTGVLTGFAFALNNIITSSAVKRNDPETVTFYTMLFSFIFLIPFSGGRELISRCASNPSVLAVAFLMCLVTAVLAQYSFSLGLQRIESGKASIYGATEPVVGTLIGIFIFHEESNFSKILGVAMVIAAIFLIARNDSQDKRQ